MVSLDERELRAELAYVSSGGELVLNREDGQLVFYTNTYRKPNGGIINFDKCTPIEEAEITRYWETGE